MKKSLFFKIQCSSVLVLLLSFWQHICVLSVYAEGLEAVDQQHHACLVDLQF